MDKVLQRCIRDELQFQAFFEIASKPRCFSANGMAELVRVSETYVQLTDFKNKYGYLSKIVGPLYPAILKLLRFVPHSIKGFVKKKLK